MRRILCAAAVAAMTVPAAAGETVKWTGFYVGAHAGYGQGEWDGNLLYEPGGFGTGEFSAYDLWGNTTARSLEGSSGLGGLQLGFNVQNGAIVWGLEGDVSWTNIEDEGSFRTSEANGDPGGVVWNIKNNLDAFGTVRGRLGVANDRLLVYATGGLAWAQTTSSLVVNQPHVTATGDADETHIGYAVGGGLEYAFGRNWSLKAEYIYMDLGSADYNLVGTAYEGTPNESPHTTDSFPADLTIHTGRVGLNYKFN